MATATLTNGLPHVAADGEVYDKMEDRADSVVEEVTTEAKSNVISASKQNTTNNIIDLGTDDHTEAAVNGVTGHELPYRLSNGVQHPKEPDSTWVWRLDDLNWPVVLCSDDVPPKQFIQTRLRPDEVAAIQLGKRKYIWVIEDRPVEYEPSVDYLAGCPKFNTDTLLPEDDADTRLVKQRILAFKQDAPQFATAQWWKNYIDGQRLARQLEREQSRSSSGGGGKRKRRSDSPSDADITPRKKRTNGHLPTPKAPVKKKGLGMFSGPKSAVPALYLDDNDGVINVDDDCEDESDSDDDDSVGPAKGGSKLRKEAEARLKATPRKDGKHCDIFIDDTPFRVSLDKVGESDYLADLVKYDDERGSYIDLPEDANIKPKEFIQGVADYLLNGDFAPRLIQKPGDKVPKLEGARMQHDRDNTAASLAVVWSTAAKLRLKELQNLAMEKLRATFPLSPLYILMVATAIGRTKPWNSDAEDEVEGWIVDHIAEFYWVLTEKHGPALMRAMTGSQSLRSAVLGRLVQDPASGRKGLED